VIASSPLCATAPLSLGGQLALRVVGGGLLSQTLVSAK
jgi:hypothetical protein